MYNNNKVSYVTLTCDLVTEKRKKCLVCKCLEFLNRELRSFNHGPSSNAEGTQSQFETNCFRSMERGVRSVVSTLHSKENSNSVPKVGVALKDDKSLRKLCPPRPLALPPLLPLTCLQELTSITFHSSFHTI